MRFPSLPCALAVFVFVCPAVAQESTASFPSFSNQQSIQSAPLTLENALATAFERNPGFAAARNLAAASEGQLTQAGVLPNPSIEVDVEDQKKRTRTTTAILSMPIETGGKRAARVNAATLSKDIAYQELSSARGDLRSAVIASFFEVAIAQEAVRVNRSNLEIANSALGIADKRVTAGKAPPLESGRASVAAASSRIALKESEAALLGARRKLGLLLGNVELHFSSVAGNLDVLPTRAPLEELLSGLAKAPRMMVGKLGADLGKAQLEVEKSKRYPDIVVGVGVARDNEMGRNVGQIGVSIPLPLFDRNQGNVYSAMMQSYRAQDLYREVEASLSGELLAAVTQFDLAIDSAREYRTAVLPGSNEAYLIARKGFEAGKFGFLEVLDAQRTLSQANVEYLTVLASAYQASSDIDRILGL